MQLNLLLPLHQLLSLQKGMHIHKAVTVFSSLLKGSWFSILILQDISDYDDAKYCCLGADVCLECWPLMTIAIKVIDTSLRDDFGFSHILWVYSGRCGVHCWVCDGKARRLNNEQRAAIVDYFSVYKGNENSSKKVSLVGPALHPFLVRSYTEVLKDYFENKLLSGRVCVPINPKNCEDFDPSGVPTLSQDALFGVNMITNTSLNEGTNGDDGWHEIGGCFRIETQAAKIVVYIQGPAAGADIMVAGQISKANADTPNCSALFLPNIFTGPVMTIWST